MAFGFLKKAATGMLGGNKGPVRGALGLGNKNKKSLASGDREMPSLKEDGVAGVIGRAKSESVKTTPNNHGQDTKENVFANIRKRRPDFRHKPMGQSVGKPGSAARSGFAPKNV